MTHPHSALIQELAGLAGIEPEYHDIWGKQIQVDTETLIGILQAMGYWDCSKNGLLNSIQMMNNERELPVPSVVSTRTGEVRFSPGSKGDSGALTVRGEAGEEAHIEWHGGDKAAFQLPMEFPPGYYQVEGTVNGVNGAAAVSSLLVYAPAQCFPSPCDPVWGTTVAAYSLFSENHRQIGDLELLRDTVEVLKANGAGFIGLLPLHLLENRSPFGTSPYYPLDRLLWNPVYLSVHQVARFHQWPHSFPANDAFTTFPSSGTPELVDYQVTWDQKRTALRAVFDHFYQTERQPATRRWEEFQSYLNAEGERAWLAAFFYAFSEQNHKSWRDWPSSYRVPDRKAVFDWIEHHERQVLFQGWLQWLMEKCLMDISSHNNLLGFDLPIGSSPDGSECWLEQELFATGASVGAPPDDFSPQGQNWGFPPVNPWADRRQHYRHFRTLLQKNMKYCRFLRIDHIMGLYRSFWIPENAQAGQGSYVRHCSDDLFAILALESMRNEVTVIGEDLGTVPSRVRELMTHTGVLSTRVFYFERDQAGLPPLPDYYSSNAFITLNTHDMPALRGYCSGLDLDLRRKLGIFDQETVDRLRLDRGVFLEHTIARFREWGFLTGQIDQDDLYPVLFPALVRYLAATQCRIRVISLEDILGLIVQPNLPSTTIPSNWRHRVDVGSPLFPERVKHVSEMMKDSGLPMPD